MDLIDYIIKEEKGIKVLSLFDGVSCARLAIDDAKIPLKTFYSSEIDKYANMVHKYNWRDSVHLGDVTKWREWDVDWSSIDLILAGSPCQGFSFAGKQLNFDDPRSALFFVFVDILNHVKELNPNVDFMLENVKMKKEYENVITLRLNHEPVIINSSLLSAQNRVRLYWCNWFVEQPQDQGIVLKDILQPEKDVDDRFYYNKEFTLHNINIDSTTTNRVATLEMKGHDYLKRVYSEEGKSNTLTTSAGGNTEPKVLKINKKGNLKNNQDKASCLTGGGHSGGNHSDMDLIVRAGRQVGRHLVNGIRKDVKGAKTQQRLEIRSDEKTNCLTTVQKDNLIFNDYTVRRLTPVECERLQTFPDDYTKYGIDEKGKVVTISNTQRYKQMGNSWTKEVVKHILLSNPKIKKLIN